MKATEFGNIAHELRPLMMKVAMDFFHNREDAEDAVQEVLLNMWKREWKPGDNIEALAIVGTKNMCVSIWRKQKLRRTLLIDDSHDTISTANVDDELIAQDQVRMLEEAIGKLPRSEQRLIRLKQEADMGTAEISAITGIPVRSVSTMMASARRKLLKLLISYEKDIDR